MTKKTLLKLLLAALTTAALVFLASAGVSAHRFYNDIFRLSSDQIFAALAGSDPKCKKISDCDLLPGDILIRRYITSRTWAFDKFAHPYFTHSAFYLGDSYLVEAIGTEKDSKDEVQITTLSKSDWMDNGLDNFAIIRPKKYFQKLDKIKNDLKNIAQDPDYSFGLPEEGRKKTTCADLIFKELSSEKMLGGPDSPEIITPDYLFWATINNPDDFEVVGYNIE